MYGIKNVVGGFDRPLTPEQQIPFTLNRTYHEHQQLRELIRQCVPASEIKLPLALELGCGYGRNLPVLTEFAEQVVGIERDEELHAIAKALNPDIEVIRLSVENYNHAPDVMFDLVLTFTFLQHLQEDEMLRACGYINRQTEKGAVVITCEESEKAKSHVGCWSRTPEQYQAALGDFEIIQVADRRIEATFPGRVSGKFVVLRKLS